MRAFLGKYWKLLFFGGLVLLLIFSYLNYWTFTKWGIGCQPDPPPPRILVDTWSKPLVDHGYKPATPQKPEHIPGEKQPPAGEVVLHGTGTVEGAEDPVELIGVQTRDGKKWLTGWVGDRQITFQHLDWDNLEVANCDDNDFSLVLECAHVDGLDAGCGISWQPVHVLGADIGPALTVDLNRDLGQAPGWIALSGRLSRSYGPFTFGGQVGYRAGEAAGLHLGLSAGLTIGF